jgi:hypothetical protein
MSHEGVWRSATVRYSPTLRQSMVIVVLKPPHVSSCPVSPKLGDEELASVPDTAAGSTQREGSPPTGVPTIATELSRLCSVLTSDPELCVVSIFGQSYSGLSQPPPNHPYQLLHGSTTITDGMCGMRFNIGPAAFFQVNTLAAEVLYKLVRHFAIADKIVSSEDALDLEPPPIVHRDLAILDVCCGTGTIGLVCSPHVAKVVGVELSEGAIEDAIANAKLNGVSNAVFVCSRAESIMPRLLSLVSGEADAPAKQPRELVPAAVEKGHLVTESASASGLGESFKLPQPVAPLPDVQRIVAIVDPPRTGLHMDVIKALRYAGNRSIQCASVCFRCASDSLPLRSESCLTGPRPLATQHCTGSVMPLAVPLAS